MTELLLFIAFFKHIQKGRHTYPTIDLDIAFLENISSFLEGTQATAYLEGLLRALSALDDAIVLGLSNADVGIFSFGPPHTDFIGLNRKSTLPRFLGGLLSSVFEPTTGARRERFNTDAVEFCLQALRLIRRAKSPELLKMAESKAAQKFIQYQECERPGDKAIMSDMRQLWYYLENAASLEDSFRLGFPGNGVTNDMQFPYVPDLCFVNPNENLEPQARYAITATLHATFNLGGIAAGDIISRLNEHEFAKLYAPSRRRIAKLAVVPKKFDEGRAITTTNTAETGVGAFLRVSLFAHMDNLGLTSMVDVRNQASSGRVLRDHFDTISCVDLEGGSSCLTVKNLDYMLSKTTYVLPLWSSSRPTAFVYKDKEYVLKTLTMGDASSVALLTITLFLTMVLAHMYAHQIEMTPAGFDIAVSEMRVDGRFRTVGDDMIFPDYLRPLVEYILAGIGVTINQRKSSSARSLHKESCGIWYIEENNRLDMVALDTPGRTWLRRIYPFRAAVPEDMSVEMVTQVIEQFVDKVDDSPYAYELFKAHCEVLLPLDYRIDYEKQLAFHPSIVGTRFGSEWSHLYRSIRTDKPVIIDDSLAYIRNLTDSSVNPRWERIPKPSRFRVRKKSVDLSAKSSKINLLTFASTVSICLSAAVLLKNSQSFRTIRMLLNIRPTSFQQPIDRFAIQRKLVKRRPS